MYGKFGLYERSEGFHLYFINKEHEDKDIIQNLHEDMIESILNWWHYFFFFFYLRPDSSVYHINTNNSYHLNWAYINFASTEQRKADKACWEIKPLHWFGGPMFNQVPGYMVTGQEEQCRPWIHLFMCLKCFPLGSCHSHTAWMLSFCTLETAAVPRETFWVRVTDFRLKHRFFAEKISLDWLICQGIRVRHAWTPYLRLSAELNGWASLEGAGAPQDSAANLLTQVYLQPV